MNIPWFLYFEVCGQELNLCISRKALRQKVQRSKKRPSVTCQSKESISGLTHKELLVHYDLRGQYGVWELTGDWCVQGSDGRLAAIFLINPEPLTMTREKNRKNTPVHPKTSNNVKRTEGYGSLKWQWLNDAFSKAIGSLSYLLLLRIQ